MTCFFIRMGKCAVSERPMGEVYLLESEVLPALAAVEAERDKLRDQLDAHSTDHEGALRCGCEYEATSEGFPGKRLQVCLPHKVTEDQRDAALKRVAELERYAEQVRIDAVGFEMTAFQTLTAISRVAHGEDLVPGKDVYEATDTDAVAWIAIQADKVLAHRKKQIDAALSNEKREEV